VTGLTIFAFDLVHASPWMYDVSVSWAESQPCEAASKDIVSRESKVGVGWERGSPRGFELADYWSSRYRYGPCKVMIMTMKDCGENSQLGNYGFTIITTTTTIIIISIINIIGIIITLNPSSSFGSCNKLST
jgi:hypothetical protein